MSRFTDLPGPAPNPLPDFPGVYVRHSPLVGHRDLTLTLLDSQQAQGQEPVDIAQRLAAVQQQLAAGDNRRVTLSNLADELRKINEVMAGLDEADRKEANRIYENDRGVMQHLFDYWLVDEQGQRFTDVSGADPEEDVGEVAAGSLISATLQMIRERKRGNVAPAGTS